MQDLPPRGSFFSELKRRHVYRVGVMYAACSFVLWQAADIVVPALGLPAVVMRVVVVAAVAGFPVALVLAWIYELTPEGIRTTRALDAEHGPARPALRVASRGLRWRAVTGVVALAVLLGTGWLVLGKRLFPPAPDPHELSLAVFPFAVRGGNAVSYLREGLMDLLSRNLAGAANLQPLDPSLVLRLSGGAEPSDREAAAGMARRAGAGRYVLGSVTQVGAQIRIDASMYTLASTNGSPATKSVQGDTTQLFNLVDELTAGLLAEYGTGAASERLVRTAASTTASLDALKAYLEGEQQFRAGRHVEGVDAFRRAIDHDSTFALARYRLAFSHHMRHEHDVAAREVRRALEHAGRLSEHERRTITAFHAMHEGRVADAERALRTAIRENERDLEARLILADLLAHYAAFRATPLTEAKRHLEAVIEADPKFACIYCQLAAAEVAEGNLDAAERWMRLSEVTRGGDTTRVVEPSNRMLLAARRGDSAEMRDIVLELDTLPPDLYGRVVVGSLGQNAAANGHFRLADTILARAVDRGVPPEVLTMFQLRLDLARGEWNQAEARATELARLLGAEASLMYRMSVLLLRGPLELRAPASEDFRRELAGLPVAGEDVPGASPQQRLAPALRLFALGLTASRAGDLVEARDHADDLNRLAESLPEDVGTINALAATVRADVALREGEPESALRYLAGVSAEVPTPIIRAPVNPAPYAARLRAAAYAETGQPELALRWLRNGVASYGQPLPHLYGTWHRDVARALDDLGRGEEAVYHYARFVDAWEYADPELLPQVAAARERLAALTGESRR